MPAVFDVYFVGGVYLGANVTIFRRNGSKTVISIYLRNECGGLLYSRAVFGNNRAYLAEKVIFKLAELVRCAKNLGLHFLEFFRDISLAF